MYEDTCLCLRALITLTVNCCFFLYVSEVGCMHVIWSSTENLPATKSFLKKKCREIHTFQFIKIYYLLVFSVLDDSKLDILGFLGGFGKLGCTFFTTLQQTNA